MAAEVARRRDRGGSPLDPKPATEILAVVTEEFRPLVEALYITGRRGRLRGKVADAAVRRLSKEFATRWDDLDVRLGLVPGKEVFSRFLEYCQEDYGFSLSKTAVLGAFSRKDVPFEIAQLLRELDAFRRTPVTRT